MMKFKYRNHRGETYERNVEPAALIYDMNTHPEYGYLQPAWYLAGHDVDKNAYRSFRLHNIIIPGLEGTEYYKDKTYSLLLPQRFGLPIS